MIIISSTSFGFVSSHFPQSSNPYPVEKGRKSQITTIHGRIIIFPLLPEAASFLSTSTPLHQWPPPLTVSYRHLPSAQTQLLRRRHFRFPSSIPSRSLSCPLRFLIRKACSLHRLRRQGLQDEDPQGIALPVFSRPLSSIMTRKVWLLCGFEGFGEEISGDWKREDCEETGREAALAGEEEHQEEASTFQNGKLISRRTHLHLLLLFMISGCISLRLRVSCYC